MGHRKESRINVRFKDFVVMDKLEIIALSKGMSLQQYSVQILINSLEATDEMRILKRTELECILTTQKLLEFSLPPGDQVTKAKSYTKDYLSKVASHAEQN